MPDECFANPRLAAIYDNLEQGRDDLDHYLALIDEFAITSVLDVGCGTGALASLLALRGVAVVGVDPAQASLAVAKTKPGAELVRWVHGDATTLPPLQVDLAVMTGNVAQVFTDDTSWSATLVGVRAALAPTGRLVLETRDPAYRAWEEWTAERSRTTIDVPALGPVEFWHEVTDESLPLVTFDTSYRFTATGDQAQSTSTLRFRERDEVTADLARAGFLVDDIRDAPDRPGREFVFVARPV